MNFYQTSHDNHLSNSHSIERLRRDYPMTVTEIHNGDICKACGQGRMIYKRNTTVSIHNEPLKVRLFVCDRCRMNVRLTVPATAVPAAAASEPILQESITGEVVTDSGKVYRMGGARQAPSSGDYAPNTQPQPATQTPPPMAEKIANNGKFPTGDEVI